MRRLSQQAEAAGRALIGPEWSPDDLVTCFKCGTTLRSGDSQVRYNPKLCIRRFAGDKFVNICPTGKRTVVEADGVYVGFAHEISITPHR